MSSFCNNLCIVSMPAVFCLFARELFCMTTIDSFAYFYFLWGILEGTFEICLYLTKCALQHRWEVSWTKNLTSLQSRCLNQLFNIPKVCQTFFFIKVQAKTSLITWKEMCLHGNNDFIVTGIELHQANSNDVWLNWIVGR